MGLLKASGDDDRLLFQTVLLHRLEVAVAPLGARRGGPAIDVHDPSVPEADEMVDRHDDAALVIDANDIDAGAGQRACDGDDGNLVRQHPQPSHAQGGRDHDQGLATIPQECLGGSAVIDRADDRGEHQLVPAGLGRGVQAVDDLRVEGLVDAEGHADESRPCRAQGPGPLVGAVAQAGCDGLDPASGLLRRPGGVAHDDRGQRDRAVRLLRDVEERHPHTAPSRHSSPPFVLRWPRSRL